MYSLSKDMSVKLAYSEMNQYVFQYPNLFEMYMKGNSLTINDNPEVWLPATGSLPPQKSKQVVAGGFLSLAKDFEISIEGYYKSMTNVIEDAGINYNTQPANWENLFDVGKGWSYGLEFYLEKKLNKTTGWIAYTLSKTERQFVDLNNSQPFPYTFDQRHNINLVINQKFSEQFDIGIVWVYRSGQCITLPVGHYSSNFNLASGDINTNKNDIYYLSNINAYSMPAYHRLDIGFNFHKKKRWGERTWSLGVYNAYNRQNTFLIYTDYDVATGKIVLKSLCIFPIIPSVTYSLKI